MPATRTFSSYKAIAQHTIGADAPASGFTTAEIVNDAFRWLMFQHAWNWRTAGPTELDITAGQNYVELPTDFGELISLEYPGTTIRDMLPSTLSEIQDFRSFEVANPQYSYWYAVNSGAINASNPEQGLADPVLEIWPTPGASESGALSIMYRRDILLLSADSDVPQIPDWMEPLAVLAVKHYANLYENDDGNSAAFQSLTMMLPEAQRRDGADQRRKGVMRGGLTSHKGNVSPFYPDHINDPLGG